MTPLRIGAVGAGRVFERLYAPALARVPGLSLRAIADPSPVARGRAGPGVIAFESLDELLAADTCEALLILSPGGLHVAHARAALARGLPIVLEKPSAAKESELLAWPEPWRAMVTPARPRRYWREYLALRRGYPALRRELEGTAALGLLLQTSPAAWGAMEPDRLTDDLLPHVIDLAEWLSRTRARDIAGIVDGASGHGDLCMDDGRIVTWEVGHGDAYAERITIGKTTLDLSRESLRLRLARRLYGRPPRDVEGVARMLRLWERRLRGEPAPGLPGFETALQEVRLRAALAAAPVNGAPA